jgi:hypothetical protein
MPPPGSPRGRVNTPPPGNSPRATKSTGGPPPDKGKGHGKLVPMNPPIPAVPVRTVGGSGPHGTGPYGAREVGGRDNSGKGHRVETIRDYELCCMRERRDDDIFGRDAGVSRDMSMQLARDPFNYDLAVTPTHDPRGPPRGEVLEGEPDILRGVTRVRGKGGVAWVMDNSTWVETGRQGALTNQRLADGIMSVTIGGSRSYTTLKLEGLFDEDAPRDIAKELRQFGKINMLYFKRNGQGGFTGEGYVNLVFANDAFVCMRDWEKTNHRRRKCFARPCGPCHEEMSVEAMNRDQRDNIQTSLPGNDAIIFNEGDADFGKPNSGVPGHRYGGGNIKCTTRDRRSVGKMLLGQVGTQRRLCLRRKSKPNRDLPAWTAMGRLSPSI